MPETSAPAAATRLLSSTSARPDSPFRVVGTVEVLEAFEATELASYAADWTVYSVEPGTYELRSNGYYVEAHLGATIVSGGRNHDPATNGTAGRYRSSTYAFVVDEHLRGEREPSAPLRYVVAEPAEPSEA